MSAALIVHKRARDFMRSSHSASQKQYEQQQLCQQDEGPGKSTGANQSSMAAVHPPLSTQIVLWPAISTKVSLVDSHQHGERSACCVLETATPCLNRAAAGEDLLLQPAGTSCAVQHCTAQENVRAIGGSLKWWMELATKNVDLVRASALSLKQKKLLSCARTDLRMASNLHQKVLLYKQKDIPDVLSCQHDDMPRHDDTAAQ
eukprot:1161826-Pelagomonas_calceolata.AAC.1